MINKQCNAGDPIETPGGLCETLNQVQCSITMNVKLFSSPRIVSVQSFQLKLASERKSFEAGLDG